MRTCMWAAPVGEGGGPWRCRRRLHTVWAPVCMLLCDCCRGAGDAGGCCTHVGTRVHVFAVVCDICRGGKGVQEDAALA